MEDKKMENQTEKNVSQNIVYWGTQATVDYAIKISDPDIFDFISKSGIKELESMLSSDKKDLEINITNEQQLEELMKLAEKYSVRETWSIRPGGSPIYSTRSGHELGQCFSSDYNFPEVEYNGLMCASLEDLLKQNPGDDFPRSSAQSNPNRPGTLALESQKYKIMLSYTKGRDLSILIRDEFVENLPSNPQNCLVAISGLNKGEAKDYRGLIESVRTKNPATKIFISTNSFAAKKNETQSECYKRIRDVYELLKLADIVSMNDAETSSLYDAIYGPKDLPLAEKFLALDLKGTRICHAAEGSLLYCNTSPEKIFDSSLLDEFPKQIQNFLQWSVDGTSFAYQEGFLPNFTALRLYSQNVHERQQHSFQTRFLTNKSLSKTLSSVPNGMIMAVAPSVPSAKGGLTGAGAVFDGYLAAFFAAKMRR